MITSTANPRIKAVAKLRGTRERAKTGHTLIDGARAVSMAQGAGVALTEAFWCPDEATPEERQLAVLLERSGVEVVETAPAVFKKIAYGDAPDRLLAISKIPSTKLDALVPEDPALVLVVEGVEKPGNLGALLRSADAVGAMVIVCDPVCDPFGPNVVRASRGTLFAVPVAVAGAEETVRWLHTHGIALFAATPDGATQYTTTWLDLPCAIAVGAEHEGVSRTLREGAAQRLSLPMRGQADSLNMSVTGAVLLYEALRQRQQRKPE